MGACIAKEKAKLSRDSPIVPMHSSQRSKGTVLFGNFSDKFSLNSGPTKEGTAELLFPDCFVCFEVSLIPRVSPRAQSFALEFDYIFKIVIVGDSGSYWKYSRPTIMGRFV